MIDRLVDPAYDSSGRPRDAFLPPDSVGLGLGLVFLLAVILRLMDLGGQSMWVDEMLTIDQGRVPGFSLWTQFLDDAQSPLPMVVAAAMARLSESEAWLRLPSALLGALSIPLMFELVRRFASDRAALIAALMLALNPMHLDHSQEVRGYAYLVFFGMAATITLIDAGSRPGWKEQAMLVICGLGAGLSNMQGLLWMGGLALGTFAGRRIAFRDALRWTGAFLVVVVLLSPWWLLNFQVHETARLVPGEETGEALRGATTWSPWALPWAGLVLAFGSTLGPSVARLHAGQVTDPLTIGLAAAAALVVIILVFAGLRRMGRRILEPVLWILPVVAIAIFLAVRNVKPFNPRYVIAALPVLLMVMAIGLDGMRPRVARAFLLGWFALTAFSIGRYTFDADYRHADVRAAVRYVAERGEPDDGVLVPTVNRVFHFYDRGMHRTALIMPGELASGEDPGALLEERMGPHRNFWYVRARPWVHDPDGRLEAWLAANTREISRTDFDGVRVTLHARETPRVD